MDNKVGIHFTAEVTQTPSDDVTIRMRESLFRGDFSIVHHFLYQGMVVGQGL
jgi:hypothetical protein